MVQFGNITLSPTKVQQILEAGRRQLSAEEFEELTALLFDLEIYGFTPWINVRLGTLMSKIQWELELEPSPEWEEALIACDKAFLGRELRDMADEAGVSTFGHKKQLCARLYRAKVPDVVVIMEPYLKELSPEQIAEEEVEQYAKVERESGLKLYTIKNKSTKQVRYAAGYSFQDACRALHWYIGDCEILNVEDMPRVLPQTVPLYRSPLREVKNRLEELRHTAPDEFYHRKQLIEKVIRERQQGKAKTMPQFTIGELQELLRFANRLYR
jgi:hypothetical protein